MSSADRSNNTPQGKKSPWADILANIKNPLTFFALALMLVEALLTVALTAGGLTSAQSFITVIIMVGVFLILVLCVVALTVLSPQSLLGKSAKIPPSGTEADIEPLRQAIGRSLRNMQYELERLDQEAPLDDPLETRDGEMNPFSNYVKNQVEKILKKPDVASILDEDALAELESLQRPGRETVGWCVEHVQNVIRKLEMKPK